MPRPQCPQTCPGCSGKLFVEIRLARAVGLYGAASRPAFRCADPACGLRFDGEHWTTPAGDPFDLGGEAA